MSDDTYGILNTRLLMVASVVDLGALALGAGDFLHFFVVALVLLKSVPDTARPAMIGVVAAINALFAVGFGYLLFGGGDAAAEGAACG